eukprot:916990-Pleurochrysis_carterae.AAC.1
MAVSALDTVSLQSSRVSRVNSWSTRSNLCMFQQRASISLPQPKCISVCPHYPQRRVSDLVLAVVAADWDWHLGHVADAHARPDELPARE